MNRIEKITFANYKAFGPLKTEIELKPITLFIGKNSSGKSSILKLTSIIGDLVSNEEYPPLIIENKDVSLGSRLEDIFHNNETSNFDLGIKYSNGITIDVSYYMDKGELFIFNYVLCNGEKRYEYKGDGKQNNDFRGLVNDNALKATSLMPKDLSLNISYIGPLRIQPDRYIPIKSSIKLSNKNIGVQGENTYTILLNSYLGDKLLYNKVATWLVENMDGLEIFFEQNGPSSGTYSLYVKHGKAKVNISDVGQGIGQIIPIITQLLQESNSDIYIIEQPALHLHPAAHANIAYLLAETCTQSNRQYIIESHSENLLLALRNAIADKKNPLRADDVIIYFVDTDEDEAYLQKIKIGTDGQLSSWPTGIFSESFDLMSEILKNGENDC